MAVNHGVLHVLRCEIPTLSCSCHNFITNTADVLKSVKLRKHKGEEMR